MMKKMDGKIYKMVWRGVQNSKTEPLKILCDQDIKVTEGTFGPLWGSLYEIEGTHKYVFNPDKKDYLVYATSDDVEVIRSDGYKLFTWNTGGYKNTGCQFIICCMPGTILKVYGYNRRTYGYIQINEDRVRRLDDVEIVKPEKFNPIIIEGFNDK